METQSTPYWTGTIATGLRYMRKVLTSRGLEERTLGEVAPPELSGRHGAALFIGWEVERDYFAGPSDAIEWIERSVQRRLRR